jgi:hypothetical protein
MAVVSVRGQAARPKIVTGTIAGTSTNTIVISGVEFEPKHISLLTQTSVPTASYICAIVAWPGTAYCQRAGWTAPYASTITYNAAAKTLTIVAGSGSFLSAYYYYVLSA